MDLQCSSIQSHQDVIERVNRLIMKHSLPVPRLISSRFINYQFWSIMFSKLFHINCDILLRTVSQRVQMLRSCLNTLESLIDIPLDHIKPLQLLNYDIDSISNLLEIAEIWSEHYYDFNSEDKNRENELNNYCKPTLQYQQLGSELYSISEPNIYHKTLEVDNSKANDLANLLYKALKNQIIALEIEKKIKLYLGDVTTSGKQNNDRLIRASRQSIVRTRAIQPLATFDFNLTREDKQNPILSVDLEKWFPEISNGMLVKIRNLEQNLFLLERNMYQSPRKQTVTDRLNQLLTYAINRQRKRIELSKQQKENELEKTKKKRSIMPINTMVLQRELRSQRAIVQEEIKRFLRSSTASYMNARSHLERILVEEFRKVEANQRDHINEIRKYLSNHHENIELEKVRVILETIEQF